MSSSAAETSQPVIPPDSSPRKWRPLSDSRCVLLVLLAIILGGLAVRTYQLSARSLWFDEAFAWRLVQFPFAEMIQRIGQDNHPPLYFILLKGWAAVFGESAFALRSLSVVFGVLTILGAYLFAVEAFGNTAKDATTENLAGKPLSPEYRGGKLMTSNGFRRSASLE